MSDEPSAHSAPEFSAGPQAVTEGDDAPVVPPISADQPDSGTATAPLSEDAQPQGLPQFLRGQVRRLPVLGAAGVLLAVLLYYPVGAWRTHVIDDDVNFAPSYHSGQSVAVAVAAALLHREVDVHGWIANKPFFMPAAILDDMPNYQIGMETAIARYTLGLGEAVQTGSEPPVADPELDRAVTLLRYPADIWRVDPNSMLKTVPSSDKQYRNGGWALENFNRRLAVDGATMPLTANALRLMLDRLIQDLDTAAAHLSNPRKTMNWA